MGRRLDNSGDRLGAWRALGCIGVVALWLGWGCGGRALDGEMTGAAPSPPPFSENCADNPLLAGCPRRTPGAGGSSVRVETCADNPLLNGCQPRPEARPSPRPVDVAPAPVDVAPAPDEPAPDEPEFIESGLLGQAKNVLLANCGACHGARAPLNPGPIRDITDLNQLIQIGAIVPCAAEQSRIIDLMRSGRMPPVQSGLPTVSAPDIDVVAQAIELGCSEPQKRCALGSSAPGCAALLAEAVLERDCGSCHGEAAREASGLADGMTYIDDMAELIANGQVIPCASGASPLLVRAQDGSMPPPASGGGFALKGRDLSQVAEFIDGLCPGPTTSGPEAAEQRRVEELLGAQCGDCHGRRAVELGQVSGGIDDIESVGALIGDGWLRPCAAEGSVLIQRLRDGSMPPPEATGPRPSAADIGLIVDFADRPCRAP